MLGIQCNLRGWIDGSEAIAAQVVENAFDQAQVALPLILFNFKIDQEAFNSVRFDRAERDPLLTEPGDELAPLELINLGRGFGECLVGKPGIERQKRIFLPDGVLGCGCVAGWGEADRRD